VRRRKAVTAGARVLCLAGALTIVPVLLWRACGPPWPNGVGRGDVHRLVTLALESPDAARWGGLLAGTVWLAWAWFAASVMLELAARFGTALAEPTSSRRKACRRQPQRRGGRLVAAWILGPALLLVATTSARRPAHSPPPSQLPARLVVGPARPLGSEATTRVAPLRQLTQPPTGAPPRPRLVSECIQGQSATCAGATGGATGRTGGGGRFLGWLEGALAAVAVEELRRAAERRRRRLRLPRHASVRPRRGDPAGGTERADRPTAGAASSESFFADRVRFTHREILEMLSGIGAVRQRLRRGSAASRATGSRLEAAASAFHSQVVPDAPCPKEAVLDLAAELLPIADCLMSEHRSLDAFAVEGVQGRLVEALVGSGHDRDAATP
jgi:hypothetical protein